MPARPRRGQLGRLRRAGKRQAGDRAVQRFLAEAGFGKALPSGGQCGRKTGIHPEADIGRPADPLAENPARPVGEPGPALRPTAVDAEEEIALSHVLLPQEYCLTG